jgi:hypothetical protein
VAPHLRPVHALVQFEACGQASFLFEECHGVDGEEAPFPLRSLVARVGALLLGELRRGEWRGRK